MLLTVILILFVILLFLVLVLFVPADAGIEYLLKDGKADFSLHVRLLKIIPLKIPIKTEKVEKEKPQKENKDKQTVSDFLNLAENIKEACKITKDDIKLSALKLKKEVNIKEVYFDIFFGTNNAAKTGILTGAIWTGSTFFVRLFDEIFGVKDVNINVTPNFEGECFNIHIKSILTLKAVNIIIIIHEILKIINIFKEKITINKEKAVC